MWLYVLDWLWHWVSSLSKVQKELCLHYSHEACAHGNNIIDLLCINSSMAESKEQVIPFHNCCHLKSMIPVDNSGEERLLKKSNLHLKILSISQKHAVMGYILNQVNISGHGTLLTSRRCPLRDVCSPLFQYLLWGFQKHWLGLVTILVNYYPNITNEVVSAWW